VSQRQIRRAVLALAIASSSIAVAGVAASAATPTNVRFVYDFPGPDFELTPLVVGIAEGIYQQAGLKVSLLFPPDTSTTSKMLTTGSADVGFITTSDMAVAVQAKAPLVSIANYSMSNNWGLFAKPGSKLTLANLKGKKIFSWGDTWTNAMLPFVLKKAGLKASDVTVVTASNDIPLLMSGKIDFTTSTSNYGIPGILEATKASPVSIVGAAAGVPNVPVWVYSVTRDYAKNHPATTRAFLAATLKATQWAIKNPAKAVADFVKKYPKSGYSSFYSTKGWGITVPLLTNAQGKFFTQTDAQWTLLANGMKCNGQLKSVPSASTYYTNAFIPQQ